MRTMASSSSSSLGTSRCSAIPQSTATTTTDGDTASTLYVPSLRLMWAQFGGSSSSTATTTPLWWPVLLYENVQEFDAHNDLSGDLVTKGRLCLALFEEHGAGKDLRLVRFLGRPLSDFRQLADETYKDFYDLAGEMIQTVVCKPTCFDNNYNMYMDFHRGLDQALQLLKESTSGTHNHGHGETSSNNNNNVFTNRAQAAWTAQHGQEAQAVVQPQNNNDSHRSPAANSVAAVSLAEDSMVSTNQTTPRHYHHQDEEEESSTVASTVRESPPPPKLQSSPIKPTASWDEAWMSLQFAGWECYYPAEDGVARYKTSAQSRTELTLHQVQAIARDHYGWRPPRNRAASRSLSPSGRRTTMTSSSGHATKKRKSFGVLWKSHLFPSGWTQVKAKHQPLVDWHYVRPGKNVTTGVKGVDYFCSDDDVLAYCERHDDYPVSSPESTKESAQEEESPMDEEEEDATMEEFSEEESAMMTEEEPQDDGSEAASYQTPTEQRTKPQDPGKPRLEEEADDVPEDTYDEYHWPNLKQRLQKCGWVTKKAKNKLGDWDYIRPGRQANVQGEDFFTSTGDVIEYCKKEDAKEQKKVAKKRQANSKKQAKKAAPTEKDENPMKIAVENNMAPWALHPLPSQGLTPLCQQAFGIYWQGGVFYLPGESSRDFTNRFEELTELQQCFCQTQNFSFLPDTSLESQQLLNRWIDYAFVPGRDSEWRTIRKLTTVEVVNFLQILGYTKSPGGVWTPPPTMKELQEFDSLQALCQALRRRESLQGGQDAGRRCKTTCLLNKDQIMALRLWMAEDFDVDEKDSMMIQEEEDSVNEVVMQDEESQPQPTTQKKENQEHPTKRRCRPPKADSIAKGEMEYDMEFASSEKEEHEQQPAKRALKDSNAKTPAKRGRSKVSKPAHSKELTNKQKSSKKTKRSSSNSQFDIKQLKVFVKGNENRAPWVVKPPKGGSLYSLLEKLGITFLNDYYLPGQSPRNFSKRYSSEDEVLRHFCQDESSFDAITKLSTSERFDFLRRLAYTYVPGGASLWYSIRLLNKEETIHLLLQLGFEFVGTSWKTPAHIDLPTPCTSLEELCHYLRRIPDLEPGGRRRTSLDNPKQLLALRLRIAEDFVDDNDEMKSSSEEESSSAEDEEEEIVPPPPKKQHKKEPQSTSNQEQEPVVAAPDQPPQTNTSQESDHEEANGKPQATSQESDDETDSDSSQASNLTPRESICSDNEGWKLLEKMGCRFQGEYRLPEAGPEKFPNLRDLAQYILDVSILVLNPHGKLTRSELATLHLWLKFVGVPYKAVLSDVTWTSDGIESILRKLGVERVRDNYYLQDQAHTLEDVVNLIRRTMDLNVIGLDEESSRGRRRSKEEPKVDAKEELRLHLWAAESDIPLPFFCEEDFCLENTKAMEDSSSTASLEEQNAEGCSSDVHETFMNDDNTETAKPVEESESSNYCQAIEEAKECEARDPAKQPDHSKDIGQENTVKLCANEPSLPPVDTESVEQDDQEIVAEVIVAEKAPQPAEEDFCLENAEAMEDSSSTVSLEEHNAEGSSSDVHKASMNDDNAETVQVVDEGKSSNYCQAIEEPSLPPVDTESVEQEDQEIGAEKMPQPAEELDPASSDHDASTQGVTTSADEHLQPKQSESSTSIMENAEGEMRGPAMNELDQNQSNDNGQASTVDNSSDEHPAGDEPTVDPFHETVDTASNEKYKDPTANWLTQPGVDDSSDGDESEMDAFQENVDDSNEKNEDSISKLLTQQGVNCKDEGDSSAHENVDAANIYMFTQPEELKDEDDEPCLDTPMESFSTPSEKAISEAMELNGPMDFTSGDHLADFQPFF